MEEIQEKQLNILKLQHTINQLFVEISI